MTTYNRRALVLGAAMVLLCSFAVVALRSFAEAAFLLAYGPRQMPWLLIANAAGFAVATISYDALTRVARAATVDLALLISLAVAGALAPVMLAHGVPAVVLVVTLAAASQVAGLALWNRVCAAVAGRDARRYLPRAGAAVTLGGALAGLGAGALIPRVGLDAIPHTAAAVTLLAIAVCSAQARALETGGAPGAGGLTASADGGLGPLQRSLVKAMVIVALLEGVVATVVDLQFIGAIKGRYTGADVAVTLALFYGGTNALLFVLQATAVPRLLVTRAMTFTAAVHPVAVILAYAGFAAAPSVLGIAGTRTADQVLHFATSRTSQELELSALPPAPRGRWKVLLRGVVWPVGVASTALVLLAIGPAALRAPAALAAVTIAIALVWAITARIAARRFQAALAAPLGIRAATADDPRRIDLATLERWTQAAGTDDARDAALARAALARARVDATDLADHLRHDDPAVRAALFEQLARTPVPSLRGELRAAVTIEDDERALALGIRALAIAGDDAGIARGKQRAGLAREVDAAVATAEQMLHGGDASGELRRLLTRDPSWVAPFVVARRPDLPDDVLADVLREAAAVVGSTRPAALRAIAQLGVGAALPLLADALDESEPAALNAIEELDASSASRLSTHLAAFTGTAKVVLARTLGAVPSATSLLATLVDDDDPDVAHAALRSALACARGGASLPGDRIAAAYDAALAALAALLDARDALAGQAAASPSPWSACARAELDVATRRCVARVLWASALEAAAAGREPGPLAASARHLLGTRDADRKRALDVVQELQARPALIDALERWLAPPRAQAESTGAIAVDDPWLARLAAGELAPLEPAIAALRRAPLFASVAGQTVATLAEAARRIRVTGDLFGDGDAGDTMYVVIAGTLVARRDGEPERRIEPGGVIGELAVLTRRPRVATVTAVGDDAEVLAIDRAAFSAASRRAPELVLGLSSTLAGWLAPSRPDVL